MAKRSLKTVVSSLSGESKMLGWDVIMALDGNQLNSTLQQDYLARLANGNGLKGYSGSFETPTTDVSHHLGEVMLGPVELQFAGAGLTDRRAAVRMGVTGGTHVQLKSDANIRKAVSVTVMGAWSNTELRLKWPMDVGLHALELDLAQTEDPVLTWFNSENEQRLAGESFKEWFQAQPNTERVSTLSTFNYADNQLMQASRLYARIQPGGEGEAALLVFGEFPQSGSNSYPGPESDFPYLIPDGQFSATAMFSRRLINRAAMGRAAMGLLVNGEFDFLYSQGGAFEAIRAKSGNLPAGARSFSGEGFEFEHAALDLPAMTDNKALQVSFQQDGALQTWQPQFQFAFQYRATGAGTWTPINANVSLDLKHEFHIDVGEDEPVEGYLYCPYGHTNELAGLTGVDAVPPEARSELKQFILHTVKRAVLERYFAVLSANEPKTFLQGVKLAGDSPVKEFEVALPFDQALFSEIHPAGATFSIVQQQPVVGVGKTLPLSTAPQPLGLQWALQPLPGDTVVGSIHTNTGVYTAPAANQLEGSFARVLATATDSSGRKSTTLITVLADAIALNPLIQQCPQNGEVLLTAGVASAQGLVWSTPAHGTLVTVPNAPLSRKYKPATQPIPGKAYVEVDVTVTQDGNTGKATVLVMQQGADGITVVPNLTSQGAPGTLQLKATVEDYDATEDVVWSVRLGGAGSIDQKGLYTSAATSSEHFVLIHALADWGPEGTYEGHIILPLPLAAHTSVLQALAR